MKARSPAIVLSALTVVGMSCARVWNVYSVFVSPTCPLCFVPWNSSIGIVMNQADLQYMETAKTTDGHYLATGAFGAYPLTGVGAQRFLGPYELVFDYACAAGDFSVINWQESSEFVDQDTAELAWGYINDDFSVNIIRARYEATVLHAIFGTWGYVVGTWDSEPSAV